ncbi:AfsR/SARP family transcriptional regulator [Streptomyces globosus]|uniref:AfsR/SARP family transcriptional regulator n=1 Tax=Streptomyces globosus TaxID=68209 RepID=UPI001FE75E20|nr:AfsR/SARP family transcriptional regulator [Streptomyces globosus]
MEFGAYSGSGVEFRILGPVEVHDGRTGARVVPSGPKQRALLAALVVRAGEVLAADRLIDELWGGHPPASAANALQAHVARLRRLLPQGPAGPDGGEAEWISTHPLGYLLQPGGASSDAQRFQLLSAEGRALLAGEPDRAAGLLRSALALWRGPALDGGARGAICAGEADRLEELRLTTLETLYEARLRCGRHADSVRELERLTARHPLRERFYDLLMLALYRCGRQGEALGVYERARRRLVDGLGVEPGPALHGRMEEILRHAPSLAAPGPAAAAYAGPGQAADQAADAEAELPALRREIALLGDRIAVLGRQQQVLLRRLQELSGATARPSLPRLVPDDGPRASEALADPTWGLSPAVNSDRAPAPFG